MEQNHVETLSAIGRGEVSLGVKALWVGVFALLTAAGAQIEIPHQPVPYTLQTMFVLLSGALLGKRSGAASQIIYVCAGIAGLPVFAGFSSGLMRLVGPSGGYLLSFPVAAFTVGYIVDGKDQLFRTIVGMAAGLFVVFSLGTVHLNLVYYHDWSASILNGFLIFSWWDMLKLCGATLIYRQLSRHLSLPV